MVARMMRDGGGGATSPHKGARPKASPNPLQKGVIARPAAPAPAAPMAPTGMKGARQPVAPAKSVGSSSIQRTAPSGGGGYMGGGGGAIGGGGGFGGGGDMGLMSAPAPAVSAPSEEDYLSGDSGYQTQLSALQGALSRYLADSDFQRSNYTTDYNRSLRDLGYDEGTKAWNYDDRLTASGRGYQNQLDDFASRGMLQSQGYADAFSELQRMLGQQYDSLSQGKNTFMSDMDNQIANYRGENTSNQQAARAEALARRAAQYQL